MLIPFRGRADAGRRLAAALRHYAEAPDLIVLALPRGGVPVGWEVARALNAPLDLLIVRKLGAPERPELAMGAIATGGARVVNEDVVAALGISKEELAAVVRREEEELRRRETAYRGNRPPPRIEGRTTLLVDDGMATGATMRAGALALRQQHPAQLAVAVPVASAASCAELAQVLDDVVCLETPEPFVAVGAWYEAFDQITDDEVRELLARSHTARRAA